MRNLLQFTFILFALIVGSAGMAHAQRASQADGRSAMVVSAASPNPFGVSAQFTVTVEKSQDVKVEVYNMLGQKVQEIFDGPMLAGETRTFVIEARSLPAGLYLYRVEAEEGVASRQITLLR